MKKYFSNFDWVLFIAVLVLLVLGLFTIDSVAPYLFFQQTLYVVFGLILFFFFSQVDYRIFERFSWLLFGTSLLLLLTTFLFGTITRGTARWIQVGGLTLQPSELVKPFLILFFSSFFSKCEGLNLKKVLLAALLLFLPAVLIFWQPDLGNSLVVVFFWLGIIWTAGISWRFLFFGVFLLALCSPMGWRLLKEYQRQRAVSFLNPLSDPLGAGYNLLQATIAVGSGQLIGRGFGRGTQSHLRFLPERQTDFIFASFAEEFGFLGTAVLILVFFVLLWRILTVARQGEVLFGYLICLGVFSMLFFQIFVNIGMNVGLLPITGITLPLISYGGSSLVATMISLGLVENVARLNRKRRAIEIR